MTRSLRVWISDMWPWPTPLDRRNSRAYWGRKAEVIRTNRITSAQVHRKSDSASMHVTHGQDPYHCVCNGTHVGGFFCPRCPQPYIINDKLEWK